MSRRLVVLACLALLLAPLALATHQGHRHWSTIPDGPYTYAPPTPKEFLASDGTPISYAVFMPNVPAGTRVPVILSAGPYFGISEEPVNIPSTVRYTGFLVDNFVSHGYAVVAASVRGTGLSGGCVEMGSLREAKDLDELVTFLANEPWSTGAVGMTGKSYDGGTPWMVAQFGNPHLKTVVPVAGVSDMGDLLFHRGSAQFRAPIMHSALYYPFGFGMNGLAGPLGGDPGHRPLDRRTGNAVCPELAEGQAAALWSTYTGDITQAPLLTDYWRERAWREPTLENYNGSVFIVHGLQDWNVIPSQVVPFFNDLAVPKKMMLGQWAHHYPDEGQATNRNDFAQILKNWFDRELKGMNVATGPTVEVADSLTRTWRSTSQWPEELPVREWRLSAGRQLVEGPAEPFATPIVTPGGSWALTMSGLGASCLTTSGATTFRTTLPQGFRLSGIGTLTVVLDPPTPGVLTASVCVGSTLVAHGGAHTLHPQGNDLGLANEIRIDLEPAERTIPAGSELRVAVRFEGGQEAGMAYWPGTSPGIGRLVGGTLALPAG